MQTFQPQFFHCIFRHRALVDILRLAKHKDDIIGLNLLDNKQFEMFLKENKYEQIFNPTCVTPCQYFDEDEFINKNRIWEEFLNVSSLNIRSLHKHGGEWLHFLKSLLTKFEVIVLTQIGAKNISVVENLIPDYNLNYVLPTKNKCGGVGIYTSDLLTNVTVLDGVKVIN